MFVWIVVVWGDMGKPMNTTTMVDMCGMNNNNNGHTISWVFVLSKSSIDYYLLTTTTAVSWVQRVSLPIAGDRGLIPRDGAIDRRYFYEPLMVITCFRVRCCYCCWCKMVVAYCRAPTYRAYWLRYVIDESMVWVGFLLWCSFLIGLAFGLSRVATSFL